jgi:hypothetical protein
MQDKGWVCFNDTIVYSESRQMEAPNPGSLRKETYSHLNGIVLCQIIGNTDHEVQIH